MRLVFGFVLLIGIGLAGFAVYMAQGYIESTQYALAKERAASKAALEAERAARNKIKVVPTVKVYVMTTPKAYGDRIAKDDVRTVDWPKNSVPEGSFILASDGSQNLFPANTEGLRAVLRAMEPGEPVMAVKVTEPGADAGVAARLKNGMRAFAIRVDVASGVSGFLRPGDLVDVYWTGRGGQDLSTEITALIDTNISIIAIDQIADADQDDARVARTVTVEVTPQQVAALAQAQATGRLALSLVGVADDTEIGEVEVDQRDLLGIEAPRAVVQAKPRRVCTIRTRRGGNAIDIPIACPD